MATTAEPPGQAHRRFPAPAHPRLSPTRPADFYVEDGREFFQNAHNLGFSSLWRVYPGYLHLFPRIASLIADAFPLKDGQIAPYAALAPGQQLNVKTSIDRRSNASWRMTLVKK